MKKAITLFAFLSFGSVVQAQENAKSTSGINKWSIELSGGLNKPFNPFTSGYNSDNSEHAINIGNGLNTYELGIRYMLSSNFGLKAKFGYDKFQNVKNSLSLPFETTQMRLDMQGVVNVGHILNFNEFTSRLGLLVHTGGFVSQFSPEMGDSEYNFGFVAGVTPQLRLSNRFVINIDLSGYYGLRQDYTFDGMSRNTNSNLTSLMFTSTAGLTYYIGKNEKHVDWASLSDENEATELDEARKRIADLEAKLVDTDNDGVLDFLDLEKNSPSNAVVDSKGRFVDVNKNGIADHLEVVGKSDTTPKNVDNTHEFKGFVKDGFVNVFYDVNKDQPQSGSADALFSISQYLKNNPSAKITIKGYADVRGSEQYNKELSSNRANNVFDFLVKSGINKDRLEVIAVGEEDNNNNSSIGLQIARRVTFTLK